ncbi:hypothetical protein SK128_006676, partial [Halocaridina rubra]
MISLVTTLILVNPWNDYLSKFTNSQLKKYCTQNRVTKIWVTKPENIDMILEKVKKQKPLKSPYGLDKVSEEMTLSRRFEAFVSETNSKFTSLNSQLLLKDKQIESLRISLNIAEEHIHSLSFKLRKIELPNQISDYWPQSPNNKILLIGDSNLQESSSEKHSTRLLQLWQTEPPEKIAVELTMCYDAEIVLNWDTK